MRGILLLLSLLACSGCTRGPAAARKYNAAADQSRQQNRFVEAAGLYRKAVRADARFGPAYFGLGVCLHRLGDNEAADRALRRALDLLPDGSRERLQAQVELADTDLHLAPEEGRLQEIQNIGSDFCRRDSRSFEGRRLLGDLALLRARLRGEADRTMSDSYANDALIDYQIATSARPSDTSAVLGLARALAVRNNFAEAETEFRKALSLDPANNTIYAELYRVLMAEGKLAEAETVLRSAVTTLHDAQGYAVMLAAHTLATDLEQLPGAIDEIESPARRVPAAQLVAGDFCVRAGRFTEAAQHYKSAISAGQFAPAARSRLMGIALFQRNQQEILALTQQIQKASPDAAPTLVAGAMVKIDERDLDAAQTQLQEAILRDPQNYAAHFQLARVHLMKGEAEQAREKLEAALKLQPAYTGARLVLAQLQYAIGEYRGTLDSIEEILAIEPANPAAIKLRGEASAAINAPRAPVTPYATTEALNALAVACGTHDSSGVNRDIYLSGNLVDPALSTIRVLRQRQYSSVDFAAAVPGTWVLSKVTFD